MNTSKQSKDDRQPQQELWGLIYGAIGVMVFSLTLPATRVAVTNLHPVFVGLGRAVVAAILAVIVLVVKRQPLPAWRFIPNFLIVASGGIIGFPLLSTLAMQNASASYGAVIIGLMPLTTALFGVWRGGEKTAWQFWLFAIAGSGLVMAFALTSGTGTLSFADLALLGSVITASFSYAEGTILARNFGSWQVICWSLVLVFPILFPIVWFYAPSSLAIVSGNAWMGFLYVSIFSMFLGFLAWYHGLFLGGIAKIGQLQLIQPFLTILASAVLLKEPLTISTIGFASGVILCVAMGRHRWKSEAKS
ncbi:MAG: DMT family transporter [Pseudanabaenaceae cyanobacterium bins.39]|nr:DMT family transporter [Pseudanabaenaceae cyanobacterium bins.39]